MSDGIIDSCIDQKKIFLEIACDVDKTSMYGIVFHRINTVENIITTREMRTYILRVIHRTKNYRPCYNIFMRTGEKAFYHEPLRFRKAYRPLFKRYLDYVKKSDISESRKNDVIKNYEYRKQLFNIQDDDSSR